MAEFTMIPIDIGDRVLVHCRCGAASNVRLGPPPFNYLWTCLDCQTIVRIPEYAITVEDD